MPFYLSFFSILPPEPVREFDTAKEALFFEKYESVIIEYKHARGLLEITDKGTISRIRDHIRSLEAEWPIQRIKQEIEAGGWGGGGTSENGPQVFRINIGLRNSWSTRLDPKHPAFYQFQPGTAVLPVGPLIYKVSENRLLDEKVRKLLGVKPEERIPQGSVGDGRVIRLLVEEYFTEEMGSQFRTSALKLATELKDRLEQNEQAFAELQSVVEKLRKDHDDSIKELVQAPILPERYGRIFSRVSFSIVLSPYRRFIHFALHD